MASQDKHYIRQFCEKCQHFNLSPEIFGLSPFNQRRMYQLGSFDEVEARADCILCRFLANAFRNGPIAYDVLQTGSIQGTWSLISDDLPDACLLFWFVQSSEVDKIEFSIRRFRHNKTPVIGDARIVEDSFVNAKLIKKWIDLCEKNHRCQSVPIESTRSSRFPDGFMVIDVIDKCLISPSSPCRYLALSYVWGNSVVFKTTSMNVDDLRKMNSFENIWDQLSPITKDAIHLTRQVGERYIWIDSLCIQQDNAPNAAANIEAMDSIYRHAALVLLIADNDATLEGLPGVSSPRVVNQFCSEILPSLQVLGRFNHPAYMDRSIYRSRGWTYQEEQLSTRALIFANRQLYFACPSHVYAEDIHEGNEIGPDQPLKLPDITSRHIREGQSQSMVYFRAVQAYTLRDLTFPSDILRAFSGICAILGQALSTSMIYGLPASIFDLALLWQPMGKLSRREGFPSWSWAGWCGAVQWKGDTMELASYGPLPDLKQERGVITEWLRGRTWIQWKYRDNSGHERLVWEPNKEQGIGKVFWPSSGSTDASCIGYDPEAVTIANPYGRHSNCDSIISDLRSHPSTHCHSNSSLGIIPNSMQLLRFQTLSIRFYIEPSNAYLRYGSIDPPWESNGRVIFLLRNEALQLCGYVLLDDTWNSKFRSQDAYEFLLLSEANYYCEWGRPHENHQFQKFYGMRDYEEFHTMMIEWKNIGGGEARVAERVGLGRVLKEAVKNADKANVTWKDVVLA